MLLDAVGDGVKLTAAGYLPPAVVSTIFEELDLGREWIGAGNREDLTVPVLELREAGQLPLGGRDATDAEWQAGVLLLALMASGSTDNAEVTVAELLTGLGWAVGDGQPVDRRTAIGLIADDVHLLHRVGAFERDGRGWPGRVTPDGIVLAGAALSSPEG